MLGQRELLAGGDDGDDDADVEMGRGAPAVRNGGGAPEDVEARIAPGSAESPPLSPSSASPSGGGGLALDDAGVANSDDDDEEGKQLRASVAVIELHNDQQHCGCICCLGEATCCLVFSILGCAAYTVGLVCLIIFLARGFMYSKND